MQKKKDKSLFKKILWFDRREKFDIDFFDALQPRRTVSHDSRYKSGVFYSEKCKRDIQYESGRELNFFTLLEKSDEVLFYWEQPVQITYKRGKIRDKYTPDAGIYLKSREFVIAEVKDLAGMLDHRVQAKIEGAMEFCSKRGFGLLLTDGKHTPEKLLEGKINRKLEKEILKAVEQEPIRRAQCNAILKSTGATQSELLRAIIRLDLKFKPFPFKLQRANQSPIFRQIYFEKKKYDEIGLLF